MNSRFTESVVEEAAIQHLQDLGYAYVPGPEIAVDGLFAERQGYGDVILVGRLRAALARINPGLPASAVEDAVQKLTRTETPALVLNKKLVARDIVEHFERRQEAMDGKAMVVCMSRRICVDLYDQIVKLRPQWDSQDFGKGAIKVVMTGAASDPERYARHLMTPKVRKEIENRFKKPEDPLKIVIVRDMWLTGFDVPCLHTMYVDKPMQGHGLMQTIARVNRVFRDKPGGLIVDYLGIAEELKAAVATYTERGGRGKPTFDQSEAIALMLEKHEILCAIFHGFDWKPFVRGNAGERLTCLKAGIEHVLAIRDGKDRVLLYARQLSEAFALSVPSPEAMRIRDDVAWFQAVRSSLVKLGGGGGGERRERDVEAAIKQLVSKSVSSDEVVDIFSESSASTATRPTNRSRRRGPCSSRRNFSAATALRRREGSTSAPACHGCCSGVAKKVT